MDGIGGKFKDIEWAKLANLMSFMNIKYDNVGAVRDFVLKKV